MPELGKQFDLFHGARKQINDSHVRPPSQTGAYAASSHGFSSGSDRPAHTDLAFATPSERVAWSYARAVPQHNNAPENNDPDPKYRSRVYEVGHASDEYRDSPNSQEVESQKGFPIGGKVHHSEIGATSTFHEVNWNAYKAKGKHSPLVTNTGDANHSYMQSEPAKNPHVPLPHQEAGSNRGRAEDDRHPDQLNLYSGKTVTEHKDYENTPGLMLSRQFKPEQISALDKDPTSKVIRRSKDYHRVDEQLGTVH